jgi:hypothetical protein
MREPTKNMIKITIVCIISAIVMIGAAVTA